MKKAENHSDRIELLDSFRAISILSVMLFHYFSRWCNSNLYPYGDQYDFFKYGYLGVHFFFIISGFVIYYSLERTDSILTFFKKRFIRLFPPILIASILTYITFLLFDKKHLFPDSHSLKHLITSITFMSPDFLHYFGIETEYLNGSYWSLWPEVTFYLYASLIYFTFKSNFKLILLTISITSQIFFLIISNNNIELSSNLNYVFIFTKQFLMYTPLFTIGIYLHNIYYKSKIRTYELFCILVLIVLLAPPKAEGFYFKNNVEYLIFLFLLVSMILIFKIKPKINFNTKKSLIFEIGKNSYFLYLIHENIGILTINIINTKSSLAPLFVIIFFIIISILFGHYIEKPINKFCNILLKTKKPHEVA